MLVNKISKRKTLRERMVEVEEPKKKRRQQKESPQNRAFSIFKSSKERAERDFEPRESPPQWFL